jgi:hypothetical protein
MLFRCQGVVVRMVATEICIMYLLLQHLSWVVQERVPIVLQLKRRQLFPLNFSVF